MTQTLNPKCRPVDLYGKMTYIKWGEFFSPRSRGPFNTGVNFPSAHGSIVLGKLNSDTKRPGDGGEKNSKLESRGPIFADFRQFSAVWALFLKIQSAITPSILGVRGSSLDSRKLSPIPFDNMPNQAQKMKIEKILVDPKHTVSRPPTARYPCLRHYWCLFLC